MDDIQRLAREIRGAKQAIRRASRTASQLQDDHGQQLGRYELQAGEQLSPAEIVEFLYACLLPVREPAKTAVQVRDRVVITVSQPTTESNGDGPRPKEPSHAQDVRRCPDRR